ncbi:MerR family transcriptional regulator [Candidatus Microgenomates bacterium]|nr:MAG: MerR family transcriptional regulator [Candidatus Microgenomates bacterium]
MKKCLNIGQAAKVVGISAKAIRYYESIKLIGSLRRESNKYRTFSNEDIQKLLIIKKARALGIPLSEIKKILSKCMEHGCQHAKEYVEAQMPKYILSIDQKIAELEKLKQQFLSLEKKFKTINIKNISVNNDLCDLFND